MPCPLADPAGGRDRRDSGQESEPAEPDAAVEALALVYLEARDGDCDSALRAALADLIALNERSEERRVAYARDVSFGYVRGSL